MRLLQMSLRVRQVAGSRRVPTPNGALLKVTLQDVAPRKCVAAEHAHVWTISRICTVLGHCEDRKIRETYA